MLLIKNLMISKQSERFYSKKSYDWNKQSLIFIGYIELYNRNTNGIIAMRKTDEIIEDVEKMVSSKGYIYSLLMIIFEDLHITLEKMQDIDHRKRI